MVKFKHKSCVAKFRVGEDQNMTGDAKEWISVQTFMSKVHDLLLVHLYINHDKNLI